MGKAAVAHVVLNRKKSGKWGHKIKKIVTQPWQAMDDKEKRS